MGQPASGVVCGESKVLPRAGRIILPSVSYGALLDGEIVGPALVGECESNLLHPEGKKVDGVSEFFDGGVAVRPELPYLRGGTLAVLNSLLNQFEPGAEHHFSPFVGGHTERKRRGRAVHRRSEMRSQPAVQRRP